MEVVIHVCDEIKNLKKDFRCSQKLLVSKMGYFAEVTTGQKLEDMDISVHCDVTIFDWLMRWVKKESTSEENWPTLGADNLVQKSLQIIFILGLLCQTMKIIFRSIRICLQRLLALKWKHVCYKLMHNQ